MHKIHYENNPLKLKSRRDFPNAHALRSSADIILVVRSRPVNKIQQQIPSVWLKQCKLYYSADFNSREACFFYNKHVIVYYFQAL